MAKKPEVGNTKPDNTQQQSYPVPSNIASNSITSPPQKRKLPNSSKGPKKQHQSKESKINIDKSVVKQIEKTPT